MDAGRQDAGAVARPRRQDLNRPPKSRAAVPGTGVPSEPAARRGPFLDTRPARLRGPDHARRQPQAAAAGLPRAHDAARSRSSRRSTTATPRARCARCCEDRRDRLSSADHASSCVRRTASVARTPSFAVEPRRAPTWASASPASRWATSSPRWCWRCCRPAATRRRSMPDVIEQVGALDGDFDFEIYVSLSCQNCPDVVQALNLMAVLNPRVRATHDRRRAVPGGGRGAADHGRADRVPERRAVRPGPHDGRGDPRQARHRRRGARRRRRSGARRRSTCWSSAAARPAPRPPIYAARKGIRTGVVAERFGGQVLDTLGIENFISVTDTEGPEARRRARAARQDLRRGRDEPAARRGAAAGGRDRPARP